MTSFSVRLIVISFCKNKKVFLIFKVTNLFKILLNKIYYSLNKINWVF